MKYSNYPIKAGLRLLSQLPSNRSLLLALVLTGLLLSGCSTQKVTDPGTPHTPTTQSANEPPLETIPPRVAENIGIDETKTDPEVIEHILAGEFLGGDGDLQGAAEEYAQAAALSDDVQIADRATRIALQGQAWEFVKLSASRWLELSGGDNEAYQALAIAQLQLDEQDAVAETLAQLIGSSEPRSRGWQLAGSVLANTDNVEQANSVLKTLINRDDLGDSADSLYGQSVLAWRLGDLQRATDLALTAADSTRRLDILEWAAQLAFAADDADAAVRTYQRALEIAPGDRDLTLALAEVLKRDGQLDAALNILSGQGNITEAVYTRAAYQLEAGNRDAAEDLYQQLTEITVIPVGKAGLNAAAVAESVDNPAIVHAFYTGQLAEQLDYKQQALDWYSQVDGGEYGLPATLRSATLLAELDRLEEAQAVLQPLQNSDDEETVVTGFISESTLLQDANMPDLAVQRLTVALGRLSTNVDLLYARSLAAAADKNVDLAEQDLRRIIRQDPNNAAALNALGYTLTDLTDRHDEALSLIEKALALNPSDASTLDSMGWVKYRLGDLAEAEDFLRKAFELDDNPEIGAHLGEVLWLRGSHEEAREVWQHAAAQDPEHSVLTHTLERFEVVL